MAHTLFLNKTESINSLAPDSTQTCPNPTDMKLISLNNETLQKSDHSHLEGRPKRQLWQRDPSQVAYFTVTGIVLFGVLIGLLLLRPDPCGRWYFWGIGQTLFHLSHLICFVSLSHLPCFSGCTLCLVGGIVGILLSFGVLMLTSSQC